MQNLKGYFCSTIGKKQIVAVTGLVWAGFVLTHMAGNMLILVSADAYNKYGHAIVSNPLLPIAEAVLVGALLLHILYAVLLTAQNKAARPVTPKGATTCEKRGSFASRSMIYSGLLVFVFVILHLITFKYGTEYKTTVGGVEMRDLHKLIVEKFNEPLYVAWYIFSLLVLGVHLSHGASAFVQSLGLGSARNCKLKKIGWAFAAVVALGFISQPLYVMLRGGQ